jgi:hypothetical protein
MVQRVSSFAHAFVTAYGTVRNRFADDDEWSQYFSDNSLFTRLMLRKRETLIPEQIRDCQPVLVQVAKRFELYHMDGEPLHLDAVFSRQLRWAPMFAAIEHENNSTTFEQEVQKLISVRCQLKVGITYTPYRRSDRRKHLLRDICEKKIKPHWDRTCVELGQEPSDTEYLFLVGHEERAKELAWYVKSFRVGDGYRPGFDLLS